MKIKNNFHTKKGFTIIEVLLATLLFAMSVTALMGTRASSQRKTLRSEKLARAVQLAQSKMTEMELQFQKKVDSGSIKAALSEESGVFEEPFSEFSWSAELTENPLKVSKEVIMNLMTSMGVEEEVAEAQYEEQRILFTNLNKALDENVGELAVTVNWELWGRDLKVVLVTHLVPKKPKIKFTTRVE